MERLDFKKGDIFIDQGAPQTKALFIADGTIKRERVVNDQSHQVIDVFGNTEPDKFGNRKVAIGALHVLHQEPSFANAMAMGPGYLYSLPSDVLKKHLRADSQLGTEVVQSLAVEVRRQSNQVRWLMRTPLLEQRPKKTNVIAVSIAALIGKTRLNFLRNLRAWPSGTPRSLMVLSRVYAYALDAGLAQLECCGGPVHFRQRCAA